MEVNPDINERFASDFMIYSFIAFFIGRLIANVLMSKFKPTFVLTLYSMIGVAVLLYTSLVPNMTAVWGAIFASVLFGPCWPTIYGRTLETVKDKYRETAGAVLVMAIIGGAVGPVVQGIAADMMGSLQLSFIIPVLFFIYLAFYFYNENKNANYVKEKDMTA